MKKRYSALVAGALVLSSMFGTVNAQQITKRTKTVAVQNNSGNHLTNYKANLSGHNHSGHHCLSDALMDDYLQQTGLEQWYADEQARMNYEAQNFTGQRATYTIPVIFHIVYNNASENLSDAEIQALLDELNEDYQLMNADASNARSSFGFVPADADIEFCLAMRDPQNQPLATPGINRVPTSVTYFDPDVNTNDMKYSSSGGTEAWNRNNYLNVWICDITNGATFGTAGYAYKPGISSIGIPSDIDGIVIDYNIGTTANSNVLTHEVGHYLGLSHTWGNSNQAAGCSDDDGLSDTPNTAGPSFDYSGSCTGNQTTCGSTQTQYENYMDYSNCTCMFTTEQANLMTSVLQGSRSSLTTSNACTPVNPQPPVADFYADVTTLGQGGVSNLFDQSTNYPTAWTWTVTPSAGVTYLNGGGNTDQDVILQFANTGMYTIELTASNPQGSDIETKTNYINVVASGGGSTGCDTVRNWDKNYVQTAPQPYTYYVGDVGGYPGHADVDVFGDGSLIVSPEKLAERFVATSTTQIRAVDIPFITAQNNSGSGTITIAVYPEVGGEPGPASTTETINIADIDEGLYVGGYISNHFEFSSPVTVTPGQVYYVGFEINYGSPTDTILVPCTNTVSGGDQGFWIYWDQQVLGSNWLDWEVAGATTSIVMDVLTSDGPAPSAALSLSATTVCEGMPVTLNGSGSINATDYRWDFYEGGSYEGFLSGNSQTFTFWQGSWDVELTVSGSCLQDVATSSYTVNAPLSSTITQNSENCNAADGEIVFASTSGGDGGPYNFSINNGATSQTGATGTTFTGLTAGTYNTIVSDNSGCADTAQQNVTRINNFSVTASATPGTTINQGQTVTLDATAGGVDYTWFEGNVTIANTQSTQSTPQVTTIYTVNAIDANGCEASDQITITVILGLDESEIGKYVNVYPNPANGIINLAVGFESTKNIEVEILDLLGQVVQTRTISGVANGVYQFDLSREAEGFYLMRINDGKDVFSTRISVVK